MLPTTDNEKESLEAHVDLCALRYANLDSRIEDLDTKIHKIEAKIDRIDGKLDSFKTEITWLLIKGSIGLCLLLLSALAAVSKVAGIW
jgi:chromosome segregation ATPase